MSIATFFDHLFTGAKLTVETIATSYPEADDFVGVALGMAGIAAAVTANAPLAAAVISLTTLRAEIESDIAAASEEAKQTAVSAFAIASLTAQAVHVAVLAAPTIKVIANDAATALAQVKAVAATA